jgi:hypothetical protein
MVSRAAVALLPLALATALSGCSKAMIVQARFVEGRIAFIGIEQELGCIYEIEVTERITGKPVWKIDGDAVERDCFGDDPHFYGQGSRQANVMVKPAKLRLETDYEVHGFATGSNSFGGAFRITHDTLYRIEDLPL